MGLPADSHMSDLSERAERAENDYEDLKTTHIEKVDAVRAEYLGKFFAAQSRAERAEAERNKYRMERDDLEAKTVERCAQVADPVRPDLANAIRALKLSDDKED